MSIIFRDNGYVFSLSFRHILQVVVGGGGRAKKIYRGQLRGRTDFFQKVSHATVRSERAFFLFFMEIWKGDERILRGGGEVKKNNNPAAPPSPSRDGGEQKMAKIYVEHQSY